MRLEIRRRVVKVSEELRAHAKERLQLALGRFDRHIERVRVYLQEGNGPRGGMDKKCRVVVEVARGSRVVVTGVGADVSAAITRTAHRAGFAVRRQVKRRLARRRLPRHTRRRVPLAAVGVLPGPGEEREEFDRPQ